MHFCNDERATVTAEQKRLAGDSFKQTLVMTKLGALWRELPEEQKAQLGADFKYTLVMTKLGEEWRGVGDKSKYEAMAAADKASKAA